MVNQADPSGTATDDTQAGGVQDVRSGDLRALRFADADLRGVRFERVDLRDAVMRAADLAGADLDGPWLFEDDATLRVNGVDVMPYVTAELERRFPGRAERGATDPAGLRHAWAAVEAAWAGAGARVAAMPAGTVDVRVDGEWSFAETLRHLVMATDVWFRGAILEIEVPYHPLGIPNAEYYTDGYDPAVFAPGTPSYDEVLAVRAERVGLVRDFLATVTHDDLAVPRRNWWNRAQEMSTLDCLHVVLNEEWEHLRFATRDLDTIAARAAG